MTHPAVTAAIDACRNLLPPTTVEVGVPDPVAALRTVDCRPERIHHYADTLQAILDTLEAAVDEGLDAQNESRDGWEGDAADAAHGESMDALAELQQEADELGDLVEQLRRIAQDMDDRVWRASRQITAIATVARERNTPEALALASREITTICASFSHEGRAHAGHPHPGPGLEPR